MKTRTVGSRPEPDVIYPVRRSWMVRRALGWVALVCVGIIAFCALVTALFVAAFGHPLAMSIIGFFFALVPITLLGSVVALQARGAVTAGRGGVGFRLFRRWRLFDVGSVRAVRVVGPRFGATDDDDWRGRAWMDGGPAAARWPDDGAAPPFDALPPGPETGAWPEDPGAPASGGTGPA